MRRFVVRASEGLIPLEAAIALRVQNLRAAPLLQCAEYSLGIGFDRDLLLTGLTVLWGTDTLKSVSTNRRNRSMPERMYRLEVHDYRVDIHPFANASTGISGLACLHTKATGTYTFSVTEGVEEEAAIKFARDRVDDIRAASGDKPTNRSVKLFELIPASAESAAREKKIFSWPEAPAPELGCSECNSVLCVCGTDLEDSKETSGKSACRCGCDPCVCG